MIRRICNYLIKHLPGFEQAYLSREAAMLGARESYLIKGCCYMTEADYYARRRFPDGIVRQPGILMPMGKKWVPISNPENFTRFPIVP